MICTGNLTYVPSGKREEIFYETHKSPVGDHKGVSKTCNRIKQKYYLEKIAMDLVGPLKPTENGNEYILTIQDQLSKFCLAVPLSNTLSTTIADAFIKKFICIFGAPKVILTDQG